jgi:glyoxylase-like metal-dependent hydrolase (beta-lactamase superfamily II)
VVVVDTTNTPASARELLAAIRKMTTRPVRYVVNTHWHDDHMMGNQVFRDAYPGVEFIGHRSTGVDLPTVGAANREALLKTAPGGIAFLREHLGKNESIAGGELTEEERTSHLSDVALVELYLAEAPGFRIIPPTMTLEEGLTLHRGSRTIEIRHLGRGHSGADLVVHLPKEGIVISGDLVVWPVPLVGSTSYPSEYAPALEKLLALRPAAIVPGHGPVLREDSYVRTLVRLLKSIDEQVRAAVARGETLEQTQERVDLDEFRKEIAGDSKLKRILFKMYVVNPAVAAAYRQVSGRP